MQRLAPRVFEQRLQHQIAAAAPGEGVAIFLAQGFHSGVAVFTIYFPAFVPVASVKTTSFLCHAILLQ